ncbi:MAG TPA: glycosyltransferase family 4 protein [Steroidobacteraceae bacterium]|nr:glycosyltransferase family 4 protein [Steroidobacteraceae bacterium]
MKIAILNQPQDPMAAGEEQRGSVAIVNWELARCLALRHQVIVYAPRARGQPLRERWGAIEIRRIRFVARRCHKAVQILAGRLGRGAPYFTSRLYYKEYFTQVARDLALSRPDIVHLPQQMQFASLFKRAAPGVKVIVHIHQDELAKLDRGLLRRDLADVDGVATVSEFVTAGARARLPEIAARIQTVGNGVDVHRFRPAARAHDCDGRGHRLRPVRLLYVGRISPDKGVHLLMEAFDRLIREGCSLELTLIGKPGLLPYDLLSRLLGGDTAALEAVREFYGRSLRAWLANEILRHGRSYAGALRARLCPAAAARVRFLGTVPQSTLIRTYRTADLLVLPSIWQESYGLPVAEAMACGVPVLASASGGVPELIEDEVTGKLIPRLDTQALSRALRELSADPQRLRAWGGAARTRAERLLTWSRSAERLERLYRGVLAAQPESPRTSANVERSRSADIA